ncbi:hypothetical protein [Bacillus massilinigeriensis]|uniref:hypothetical protein n=1 Tax=Bacillus mediterraneensis TaxID=1805474 RepID=UPI0008F941FC|nr:hypothetical protein [Bacillus mediterraneensis]
MIQLPQNLKRKQLPGHILFQLEPLSYDDHKMQISMVTFFLIDALLIAPLFVIWVNWASFITLPMMIIINIWAIALLFRKSINIEIETILFVCYAGLVGSICYFVAGLKQIYLLGMDSLGFYLAMAAIYLVATCLFVFHQFKKYSLGSNFKQKETPAWHYAVASIAIPAGYIASKYLMRLSESIISLSITVVLLLSSYGFMWLFAKYFHKYFFIKKNIQYVKLANKEVKDKLMHELAKKGVKNNE